MVDVAYQAWIRDQGDTLGSCAERTADMVAAFPELRRVRGQYYCPIWGERDHWWCVAEDRSIVDPTASQFPSGGLGEYVEWQEGKEEPIGKCMVCGAYCCGPTHLNELEAEFC